MDAKADASETAADARAPERDMEAFGDEETNALMAAQHFASHHPRFSPCSVGRCVSTLMMPLILAIVVGTWLPYVYVHADGSWLGAAALVVFHVLVFLMLASFFQTWYHDAGTVPEDWHSAVVRAAAANKLTYRKCGRTGKYKPPRSHYDPVTGRLVLNMDHFCPWVANTVGYHNRKFFILFTAWGCLACAWASLTLIPFALRFTHAEKLDARGEAMRSFAVMAAALDGTFAVCLLCFSLGHLYMAASNTTSLEGGREAFHFDLGWRRNLEQVFGRDRRLWLLPVYGSGPVGDGVVWTLRDGSMFGLPDQDFQQPPPPPQPPAAQRGEDADECKV